MLVTREAIDTGAIHVSSSARPPQAGKGAAMSSHPLKGAFQPEERKSLQANFDEITSQPWFPKCPKARNSFAKYLFETLPGKTFNAERHRSVVEASARMFYAVE